MVNTRGGHDVIVYVEKGGKAAPSEINPPRRLCISTSACLTGPVSHIYILIFMDLYFEYSCQ